MALRDNTIGSALDALEAVIGGALMTSELAYFNGSLGFTMTTPKTFRRGDVMTHLALATPVCQFHTNSDEPAHGWSSERGYHRFKVVIALQMGLHDVKDGASQKDLYEAITTYNEVMRRAVTEDVSTPDPGSTLRAAGGVVQVGAFTTYYEPLEAGPTESANFVVAVSTATFTQLRPSRTSA